MSQRRDIKSKCCELSALSLCDAPIHCAVAQFPTSSSYDGPNQRRVRSSDKTLMKTEFRPACSADVRDLLRLSLQEPVKIRRFRPGCKSPVSAPDRRWPESSHVPA